MNSCFVHSKVFYLCDFREPDRDGVSVQELSNEQVSVRTRITDKSYVFLCECARVNLYIRFKSSQLNHTESEWNTCTVFAFQSQVVLTQFFVCYVCQRIFFPLFSLVKLSDVLSSQIHSFHTMPKAFV